MEINEYTSASSEKKIKVLMYHKIIEDKKISMKHWTYVSARQFKRQLKLLEQWGFTAITFKDFLSYKRGDFNLPKKSVIITFDDGYENIYKIAYPIVKEFGWNAVVFVLGNRLITSDVWDKKVGLPASNLLNQEQIIEMNLTGFEIGSHSMNHIDLKSIPLRVAENEIIYSKKVLEDLLEGEVTSFCYPFGSTNEKIKELVKRAGYKLACGVYTGNPVFCADKYDIRRITISNTTNSLQFAIKMLTPYEYYEWYGSRLAKMIKRKPANKEAEQVYTPTISDRKYINV